MMVGGRCVEGRVGRLLGRADMECPRHRTEKGRGDQCDACYSYSIKMTVCCP
nr:MAG TPA: hypothetical protein [Caudoviricetes sp.]